MQAGCTVPAQDGPPLVFDAGADPETWAQVPAGEYLHGQHEKESTIAQPCEVMVTGVTNAQFARYLNEALAQGAVGLDEDRIVGYYPGDTFHGHKHEEKIERTSANFYDSRDPFKGVAGKQGDTTPVGFYNGRVYNGYRTQDARSPYGLYDMAGNVWQWASDITEGTHDRYLLGGSKDNYGYNLRVWTRNSARPDYYSPSVGFRCAR
jgi:formylglycine-generating enzyme required for sulfatase activity